MLHLTECPRDAMQGIKTFIPTERKIQYLSLLLKCNFTVLDAGSFVSASAIPQMADTAAVFDAIAEVNSKTKILAIVANARGAAEAASHSAVSVLGYPFSVSDTFQKRNTNASIDESYGRLEEIINITQKNQKQLRVYLSMAFGNPYGDQWSPEKVALIAQNLKRMGVAHLALSDTIGSSTPESITSLYTLCRLEFPQINWSLHLHALPEAVVAKLEAAWRAGCRELDAAMLGFGGCPMAADALTGNMQTERVMEWCKQNEIETGVNIEAFNHAQEFAQQIFTQYH
ncbi:MAG: hydroxymethylglutaryl-CoA lyase [Bacteroidia bacterium]